MTYIVDEQTVSRFLERVRDKIARRMRAMELSDGRGVVPADLMPGKMLRTRFGARLTASGGAAATPPVLERACAAVEVLHTATLCHDDVIDNALIRRGGPTLWRVAGPSAAVMIGDWLLCDSVQIVREIGGGAFLGPFLEKVQETCRAESEHEITAPGERLNVETCLRLARGKAGPLFSFLGYIAGGDDVRLREALEEAGYCVGTAYQLSDDLLDIVGDEDQVGKTLGTDAVRKKFTLSQVPDDGVALTRRHLAAQCRRALRLLGPWPEARAGLHAFLKEDLWPVFRHMGGSWEAVGAGDMAE